MPPRLRILGVDPGSRCCGYGVIDLGADARGGMALRYVECGVIQPPRGAHLAVRLRDIAGGLREVVRELAPGVAAVERVFFHANARSALDLGQARGVALLCAAEAGIEVVEYTPARVKLAVTGSGRAPKTQVQQMVRALVGLRCVPRTDAADALAVAICHAYASRHAVRALAAARRSRA